MVVASNKDLRQLGIDVLRVNATKPNKFIKAEENNIGLRGYRVNFCLKENHHPPAT